ncbi:MAG: protein jag [Clostridia bacterium]|nr:protein jag [Clostridia bacterium]
MDYSEKWGTSIDEAVELALADLKLTKEDVNIIVLEEPSKGFLGFGSKLAKVRVEKKAAEPEIKQEPKHESHKENFKQKHAEKVHEKKEKAEKPEKQERKPKPEKKAEQRRPALELDTENMVEVNDHAALTFIKEVTEKMNLNLDIRAKQNDECILIDIQGKDSGTIIGKRGQTLDALQYLTSLVVNKNKEKYMRVVVDAENYRSKRERTLEQLANRLADKVQRTKKSVRLEPMNPYERKVIHATLQNNANINTRSEGEEPYRRVIIELK